MNIGIYLYCFSTLSPFQALNFQINFSKFVSNQQFISFIFSPQSHCVYKFEWRVAWFISKKINGPIECNWRENYVDMSRFYFSVEIINIDIDFLLSRGTTKREKEENVHCQHFSWEYHMTYINIYIIWILILLLSFYQCVCVCCTALISCNWPWIFRSSATQTTPNSIENYQNIPSTQKEKRRRKNWSSRDKDNEQEEKRLRERSVERRRRKKNELRSWARWKRRARNKMKEKTCWPAGFRIHFFYLSLSALSLFHFINGQRARVLRSNRKNVTDTDDDEGK